VRKLNTAELVAGTYIVALEAEFSADHAPAALRLALQRVDAHTVTGNGKVKGGLPFAGVRIDSNSYRFRLTDVNGEDFSWIESSPMTYARLPDFVQGLRDLLNARVL
jgi:hypothetical protein